MFYKRKLWTENLSPGHFFVWNESIASRGSDEICSCLNKYLEEHDIQGDTLIAISDNCSGQNKNCNLITFWMYVIAKGCFLTIEHHFPLSGHSMLPCDRNVRQHVQHVYTPQDWAEILKKCDRNKPFCVHEMHSDDFLQFSDIKKLFCQRNVTEEGYKVVLRNVVHVCTQVDTTRPP
ncbi:hypothetical protein PR048_031976 [Dryococelus australis]|uniref:DUF7869 domain-containing protein n=1 Tax=Dryococelus australis TaxID=614101 RepID=A0ABQ9G9L7_9NEOP|nr:hypothetical protein PR048_031976 [Dryococelus australis]